MERVAAAERVLSELGLSAFRVRSHGDLARLEFSPADEALAWPMRREIETRLRKLGFSWVALDLDGYRSGSLNVNVVSARSGPEPH